MFQAIKKTSNPITIIEGLPQTQVEETNNDSTVEELFT
jgi:hypothetical protein